MWLTFCSLAHHSWASATAVKKFRGWPELKWLHAITECLPMSSYCRSDLLQAPRHLASKFRTHPSVASFACSSLHLQYEIYVLQATNTRSLAVRLWVSLHSSTMKHSPLSGCLWQSTGKATSGSIWYPLAANFASEVGACIGVVESFKHLLCATAHPQFLLELQAPMGACQGQCATNA